MKIGLNLILKRKIIKIMKSKKAILFHKYIVKRTIKLNVKLYFRVVND